MAHLQNAEMEATVLANITEVLALDTVVLRNGLQGVFEMNKLSLFIIFLLSTLLSGCYESDVDLIGENENKLESFESLIVNSGNAYIVDLKGDKYQLCAITNKSDLADPCGNKATNRSIKFERTYEGNYIVQIQDFVSSKTSYKYGLWFRSEENPLSEYHACFVWLGDGIVGSNDFSQILDGVDKSKEFNNLSIQLMNISRGKLINREQLIKIANAYEMNKSYNTSGKQICWSSRTKIDSKLIKIEGDYRPLKAFETFRKK